MLQCVSARHRIKLLTIAARFQENNIELVKSLIPDGMTYTIDANEMSPADYLLNHYNTSAIDFMFDYNSEKETWNGQEFFSYNILKYAFSKDKQWIIENAEQNVF